MDPMKFVIVTAVSTIVAFLAIAAVTFTYDRLYPPSAGEWNVSILWMGYYGPATSIVVGMAMALFVWVFDLNHRPSDSEKWSAPPLKQASKESGHDSRNEP